MMNFFWEVKKMREDKEVRKAVKGGFRATLALIISIIALILAIISYNRTSTRVDLIGEIKALQNKLENVKQETSERVNKIRQETIKTIKKMGVEIKRSEKEKEDSKNQ